MLYTISLTDLVGTGELKVYGKARLNPTVGEGLKDDFTDGFSDIRQIGLLTRIWANIRAMPMTSIVVALRRHSGATFDGMPNLIRWSSGHLGTKIRQGVGSCAKLIDSVGNLLESG